MDTQKLIEIYVDEVTRRLPRKMRADVGDELRALLAEEMHGKTPDEAAAALRNFGRPSDVAARYHPMFAIVDPSDTRAFFIAALAGLAVVALIAAPMATRHDRDMSNLLALAWLGFLVVWFGIKSWAVRRWPASNQWRPRDRAVVHRAGSFALVLVILLGIAGFGAPDWIFAQLTHGRHLAPMLSYTDDFQAHRLPFLLAAWGCSAVLYSVILVEGRWRALTRRIDVALNVAVVLILTWYRFGPPIFQDPRYEAGVRSFLAVAVGVVLIDTAVKIYNTQGTARVGKMA
jgi:hypothetical protein